MSFLTKGLDKVDTGIQMEASMVAMGVMLIGVLIGGIYATFFTGIALGLKILAGINSLAGVVLLSSFFATSYHQYKSYKEAIAMTKHLEV